MPTFNLIKEPWVPCIAMSGKPKEYSLLEMFNKAHELKCIESDNPLNTASLYRLSLAILHRAIQGPKTPKEWYNLWKSENFIALKINEYFERLEVKDRFDLFSEQAPFYQTAGFKIEKSSTPVTKLAAECASGNNKTLFDHNIDAFPKAFSPQESARAIITAQMFSFGGGVGPTSNLGKHPNFANGPLASGALILLQGNSLFETLLLNLLVYNRDIPIPSLEYDLPVWERKDMNSFGARTPDGYVDYLTWQSRHVRLIPEYENNNIIVRQIYYAQADIIKPIRDPMFGYRDKGKPIALFTGKSLWRDSQSLFAFSELEGKSRPICFRQAAKFIDNGWIKPSKGMRCIIYGIAKDGIKATPLFWRQEFLPIPKGILTNEDLYLRLVSGLNWVEKVGEALKKSVKRLASVLLTDGMRNANKKEVTRVAKSLGIDDHYWASMQIPFLEFMVRLPEIDELKDWKKQVVHIADQSLKQKLQDCLGHFSRDLQARVKAIRAFHGEIKKLNKH